MERDRLFLLPPEFDDPAYPNERFYCWQCALLRGLLGSFPEPASRLDVETVPWPRPRQRIVAFCGDTNQSLPMLLLADGQSSPHRTGLHQGLAFISDHHGILAALHERHGFPSPHP